MAAVEAHPARLHVADKELVLPHQLGEALKALPVDFFDSGNLLEVAGNLREPLLLGLLGKGGVDVAVLVHLMVPGQLQQLQRLLAQINRVVGGEGYVFASPLNQMVVEDLPVLLLLSGGVEENGLQHLQPAALADLGGKGVAVSGLALAGKGPQQVFFGCAVFQLHRFGSFPILGYLYYALRWGGLFLKFHV